MSSVKTKEPFKSERLVLDELGDAAISAFVDLLQKYPIVWDKTLPDYKNNIKKGLAFKAMDKEMRDAGHTSAGNLKWSFLKPLKFE